MYQNKYKNSVVGAKKQKEQNSGKKPKPQKKPEWNTSVTDDNKYKLSAAELVQKKVAHVSKHRFQAKEEWQQRQKKLQEGILDEETSKIYETARESKNLNSGKYDRVRRNLSQMIDYNKSFLSNNSELYNDQDGYSDFQNNQKNNKQNISKNTIKEEKEEQNEDFIDEIQKKVLQTREFIKKMEACKCNTEDPKQVIKAQEHAVSKTLQFQRKKENSVKKTKPKVNNYMGSQNKNKKTNDENFNDSNFISDEQQGLKEVEKIKNQASKHMQTYFSSLAKIEDTIKFMENNIINSDKKIDSSKNTNNISQDHQISKQLPEIDQESVIQKNKEIKFESFADSGNFQQQKDSKVSENDKLFLLQKISEIKQQDSQQKSAEKNQNEQKNDNTDNVLTKKINFDHLADDLKKQQKYQNDNSPQKEQIHGILKNKDQQNYYNNNQKEQNNNFQYQNQEQDEQYMQFEKQLLQKQLQQNQQQQQQLYQEENPSFLDNSKTHNYNNLYNNDQSEVREVSILDDDDLDMNKIRDMLENTKKDLEQLNSQPMGLQVPQLSFTQQNNQDSRLIDITNVQSQQQSNFQNMFTMKKNPQDVIQLNTSSNHDKFEQFQKYSNSSLNNNSQINYDSQINTNNKNQNNNIIKQNQMNNYDDDEDEEGPRNFNVIQQNQFRQQVQNFEKKYNNESLSIKRQF